MSFGKPKDMLAASFKELSRYCKLAMLGIQALQTAFQQLRIVPDILCPSFLAHNDQEAPDMVGLDPSRSFRGRENQALVLGFRTLGLG